MQINPSGEYLSCQSFRSCSMTAIAQASTPRRTPAAASIACAWCLSVPSSPVRSYDAQGQPTFSDSTDCAATSEMTPNRISSAGQFAYFVTVRCPVARDELIVECPRPLPDGSTFSSGSIRLDAVSSAVPVVTCQYRAGTTTKRCHYDATSSSLVSAFNGFASDAACPAENQGTQDNTHGVATRVRRHRSLCRSDDSASTETEPLWFTFAFAACSYTAPHRSVAVCLPFPLVCIARSVPVIS